MTKPTKAPDGSILALVRSRNKLDKCWEKGELAASNAIVNNEKQERMFKARIAAAKKRYGKLTFETACRFAWWDHFSGRDISERWTDFDAYLDFDLDDKDEPNMTVVAKCLVAFGYAKEKAAFRCRKIKDAYIPRGQKVAA